MLTRRRLAGVWVLVVILLMPVALCASPREEDGVIVEDFEDGNLDAWEAKGERVEVEPEQGNNVLELGGAELWLKDRQFRDFSLEARVRREYNRAAAAGFVFRGDYRLWIHLIGRLKLSGPNGAQSRGLSRGIDTDRYRNLKIVCAGPTVRFYIDGEYEGEFQGLSTDPAPIALFGGNQVFNSYFDDVRIDTNLDPGHFLSVEPQAEDECLVFPPRQDVSIAFKVANHHEAAQQAEFGVEVRKWTGEEVVAKASPVELAGGAEETVSINFGALAEGYYKMLIKPMDTVFPLAIQERGTGEYEKPDIVLAAYWYFFHGELPTIWRKTYDHAAAADLRRHHFNAVVASVGMPVETQEILSQYGISTLVRGTGKKGQMEHPSTIGSWIGDEPKPDDIPSYVEKYEKVHAQYPEAVITTCMIGDGGLKGHVFDAWEKLAPIGTVRTFRWYGIKKAWEGINRVRGDKPPYTEVLRQAREPGGPYWVILPSFGQDGPDAYYGNPTPAQIKAMMHLTVANAARGVIFYTYHRQSGDSVGFVEPASLVPSDGKWDAAGEVAEKIERNAKLLASLTFAGSATYIDDYAVEGYLFRDEQGGEYFYLVNTDTRKPVDCRLFKLEESAELYDLYAERDVPIEKESVELLQPGVSIETGVARFTFGPGEGTFLRYTPAAASAETPRFPRVAYPEWVSAVPADRTQYLIELEAANTPMPGWVPMHDHKKNPWHSLNADAVLYAGKEDPGQEYKNSLYAQAETEIVYELPEGYTHFVAAAGLGNKSERASVVFRVLVDGQERYRSEVYRNGDPILPVVVDVTGAEELRLRTEEAGDGLYQDYAWWGEARLLKK